MSINCKAITYQANGDSFTGFLACNDDGQARPAVVIVHEWWGNDDYVKGRARQLANEGYTAFAPDMYGTGKSAANPDEAAALMNSLLDIDGGVERRFDAAIDILKQQDTVDSQSIAAIGYCFGGAVVLNMARAGKDLKAVASFHGLLETQTPMQVGAFAGEIAVFTGADDPMVSPGILAAFEAEMDAAGVTCSLTSYPGVMHGFTNPAATARGNKYGLPLKYDAAADHHSFQSMLELLSDVFHP